MESLTTPPRSEDAHWHTLKTPVTFSAEQVTAFQALFPMNALQEHNKRLIVLGR